MMMMMMMMMMIMMMMMMMMIIIIIIKLTMFKPCVWGEKVYTKPFSTVTSYRGERSNSSGGRFKVVSTEYKASWFPETGQMLCRRNQSLVLHWNLPTVSRKVST